MPLLLADFIHARVCKPVCEKFLTLPYGPVLFGLPTAIGSPCGTDMPLLTSG